MQVLNKKKLPKGLLELKIEVLPKDIEKFIQETIESVVQEEEFPGFRKGKVPPEIVKKRYSEMDLLNKSLNKIISVTYYEVLIKEKILAVGQPKIEILKIAPNNPLVYKATLALLPRVKLAEYSNIKVKKRKIEISNEERDKLLKEIQKMRAKETLVNRKAKMGDKVLVDINMSINKIPLEGGQSKNTAIFLGDSLFLPGLDKKIVGMGKNEIKEFTLLYPEDHYDKKLAGKKVEFKIKVNAVYQIDSPEINDEFARSVGKFKNVNELKDKLKENLKLEAEEKENQRLESEILEKIVQNSEFEEIPEILLDNIKEKMIKPMPIIL